MLGDPDDDAQVFSYARCLELDDREEFPDQMCAELDRLGLASFYVPDRFGGSLTGFDDAAALIRLVARRDLTVAIAHAKTFLGAAPVWVSHRPDQAAAVARSIMHGERLALALTEPGHGSDLLSTETLLSTVGTQFMLKGTKWMINNATRAEMITVLARTGIQPDVPNLTLVLVDKRELAREAYQCLPKIALHGIRGADISGIAFHDAIIERDRVVGSIGHGLDAVLRAFQLTRTACAALSLGAADQAIDLAWRFCQGREIYGARLIDIPLTKRTLGIGLARRFVAEAVVTLSCRAANTLTGEMSVVSAVVKSFVPTLVDELIGEMGELLGARAFLLNVFAGGRFQKVERDHRIVGIFDGSVAVNQNYLVNQFPRLGRGFERGRVDVDGLANAADLGAPLPPLDYRKLTLVSRIGCSITQSLPDLVRSVRELRETGEVEPIVVSLAEIVSDETTRLHEQLRHWRVATGELPAQAFGMAQRYEWCYAGAACLAMWIHNRPRVVSDVGAFLWQDGSWLVAALTLVVEQLLGTTTNPVVFEQLVDKVDAASRNAMVSMIPTRLDGVAD
jgi:alkylation response protein AidB-like acyl-CoA dehydrogenase